MAEIAIVEAICLSRASNLHILFTVILVCFLNIGAKGKILVRITSAFYVGVLVFCFQPLSLHHRHVGACV